jgi:NitT/TauT family transport system substrate-binding protein
MPEFAQAVLKERGLSAPLGEIKQLPESAYTGPK